MIAGNTGSCTEFATKEWLDKFMHRLTVSPLTDGKECVHISHPAYSTPPLSMARAYCAVVLSHSVGLCTCGDILVEHLCSPPTVAPPLSCVCRTAGSAVLHPRGQSTGHPPHQGGAHRFTGGSAGCQGAGQEGVSVDG